MVDRGSNLTLRCEVKVSHSSSQLMHTLKFLRDERVVYSKNTTDAVVDYSLVPARASHSGLYICQVQIDKKEMKSKPERITVKGLQTPLLNVQPSIVNEGDEVVVTCSAPDETGGLNIYFYKNNTEIKHDHTNKNSATFKVKVQETGFNIFHCNYMLMLHPTAGFSNNSKNVKIFVRALEITPSIRIIPKADVVEGDRVGIFCNVSDYSRNDLEVFLTSDTVLHKSHRSFEYSFVAKENNSGEYVCKTEWRNVQKSSKAQLKVKELFSRPVLSMTPDYVFEGQKFTLKCKSLAISEPQINVKYTLYKDKKKLSSSSTLANKDSSGTYYCEAEANNITKASTTLVVNVKVPVSVPAIHTVGKIIIGQPFQLQCESEQGTLPITYTLLKSGQQIEYKTVTGPQRSALFNISSTISDKNEIRDFTCQAENQGATISKSSLPLNVPVIETVSKPHLTLKTKNNKVSEGEDLILDCSVDKGTVPITFTWYRTEVVKPLNTTHINNTKGSHIIKSITRDYEGRYFCEASNDANKKMRSHSVPIEVKLAGWKKALIGVSCILILVLIVIILLVFLKKAHTPQKRKKAVELSVKPARAKSTDPMRVSLTLDIEDNTVGNDSDKESEKEESEISQDADKPPLQNVTPGGELVTDDADTAKGDIQDITQDEKAQVSWYTVHRKNETTFLQNPGATLNNIELQHNTKLHKVHRVQPSANSADIKQYRKTLQTDNTRQHQTKHITQDSANQ
ncbi:platelet endothelial cell adhesion molecule isoform X2 [Silurus meridionalis]|nr:platelet endothelial cell adhesion molecule isoform X2 [Silurus meridionalis]